MVGLAFGARAWAGLRFRFCVMCPFFNPYQALPLLNANELSALVLWTALHCCADENYRRLQDRFVPGTVVMTLVAP